MLSSDNYDFCLNLRYFTEGGHSIVFLHDSLPNIVAKVFKKFPDQIVISCYVSRCLPDILKKYLCPVEIRLIADVFVSALLKRVLEYRPAARVAKFDVEYGIVVNNRVPVALEMRRDCFPATIQLSADVCFEIKPKTGRKCVSRLISSNHASIKYNVSRFNILQMYKLGKLLPYDPEEFFSPYPCRLDNVFASVSKLMAHPSKYLRISVSGRVIFDEASPDSDVLRQGLEPSLCLPNECVNIVTSILCQECDLLDAIRIGQSLDVIDIEGASVLVRKLASLKGASMEECIECLNDWSNCDNYDGWMHSGHFERLYGILYPLEHIIITDGSLSRDLCSDLMRFESNFSKQLSESPQPPPRLDHLTAIDCEELLRYWMISKCLSDCSILVTFKRMATNCQDDRQIKRICVNNCDFVYCVSLIDIGPKSFQSLLHAAQEEQDVINKVEPIYCAASSC